MAIGIYVPYMMGPRCWSFSRALYMGTVAQCAGSVEQRRVDGREPVTARRATSGPSADQPTCVLDGSCESVLMNIEKLRKLLKEKRVTLRFTDHAFIEARKDGLIADDLKQAVTTGEVIKDYGARVLLLSFTKDDRLPCHVVLEYVPGTHEVTVVTAYVPAAQEWRADWKRRRRKRRR